jgi:hypothetical protein
MTTSEALFDGREMLMLHNMFRREFALMPGVVRGVPDGDLERTQLICAHITSVSTVPHHHHRAEEERMVPLMERHITAAEWNQMVEKGAAGADPAGLPLGFGMLMYEGDPEVVDAAIASMPEQVHGTATPPRSTDLSLRPLAGSYLAAICRRTETEPAGIVHS